jgi:ABC-2 type transport system ATP-binding protein
MIRATNLVKEFAALRAVDGLSLEVQPGELFGFLGPNGAGKSTTVRMLTGLIRPTSGRAEVAGYDVVAQADAAKSRIGYVPESGALYETLTPLEYLEFVGCLRHIAPTVARTRASALLDLFGAAEHRNRRLQELSRGTRQKVLIVAALLHNPDVLILDEPMNALDANAASLLKETLRGLTAQGRTVLFSSHVLDVVERVCTRMLIIDHGMAVALGTAAEITAQTGTRTLEDAFVALTGVRNLSEATDELLAALGPKP